VEPVKKTSWPVVPTVATNIPKRLVPMKKLPQAAPEEEKDFLGNEKRKFS
jgi:hypothetical protein